MSLILTSKHNCKPAPHAANRGTQNNGLIHRQSHTSRIEDLSHSLADPSENNNDNIQLDSNSDYPTPQSKKRSQLQMQAGQDKEIISTLNHPTPTSLEEDDTTPAKDIPWKQKKPHGAQHPHCLSFPVQPKIDCAADHPDIRGTNSLCWTFLQLTNAVHDEHQSLTSGIITCAFCIAEGKHSPKKWENWNKIKSQGSTGNFKDHFESYHHATWQKASAKDLAIRDLEQAAAQATKPSTTQTTLHSWTNSVSVPLSPIFLGLDSLLHHSKGFQCR